MAARKSTSRKKGLTPSIVKETTQLKKIELDQEVLEEFTSYLDWVGVKTVDEGIEKAMEYVLSDDADWQKYKKSLAKQSKGETTVKPETQEKTEA